MKMSRDEALAVIIDLFGRADGDEHFDEFNAAIDTLSMVKLSRSRQE